MRGARPRLGLALACAALLAPAGRAQDVELESDKHVDEFRLRRSPRNSAFRSLVVPGWGQWHTGHQRKAWLAVGVELGLAGWAWSESAGVDRALEASRAAGETQADHDAGLAPHYEDYLQRFELRRDLLVYLGLAVVGFALDAYVDAWLYGRDEEFEDFPQPGDHRSISLAPEWDPEERGLRLALRIDW